MLDKSNAKLVETKKSKSGSSYKVFTFECVDCGSDVKSQLSQLKTHSGKCRICTQRKRPYEHILNELIHTCKNKSKQEIDLTYEDFIELIKDSNCHYCSKKLIFSEYTRDENKNYTSRAYQLDRMDNSKGYIKENLVPCCWNCNRMKSDIYLYKDFIKLSPILKEIYNEQNSK